MEFFTFLLIFLIMLYLYLSWQQKLKKEKSPKTEKIDEHSTEQELRIENVGKGGIIALVGVGDHFEDMDLIISAKHCYEEEGFTWYELEAEKGGGQVYIELEDANELKILLTMEQFKLKDLDLNREDLEEMVEADDGSLDFNGRTYYYEDTGATIYYDQCNKGKGERFRYWLFQTDDEEHLLSIEEWKGGATEVSLSERIKPHQIHVYQLREGEE